MVALSFQFSVFSFQFSVFGFQFSVFSFQFSVGTGARLVAVLGARSRTNGVTGQQDSSTEN